MDIPLKFRRFRLLPALRPFVFGWRDSLVRPRHAGPPSGADTPCADMPFVIPADGPARRIDAAAGYVLRVESGCVWLTESDDPDDHFIAAGCSHRIRGRGPVVIEAHGPHTARARVDGPWVERRHEV